MVEHAVRPLRIVLAAVGSRGDVQPMLALAQVLSSRGHLPVVAAPANFEAWVRSHGFEYRPLGADVQAFLSANSGVLTGNPVTGMRMIARYFAEEIPVWARQMVEAGQGADAVLWSGLAISVPSAAEHLGIPAIGVCFSTSLIPSSLHPPPTIAWHGLPRWLNRFFWMLNRFMVQRVLGGPLNGARAELGLPPVVVHDHIWDQGQYVLALDAHLSPSDPSWPPSRFPYANYIYYDDPAPLDAQLQAWLDEGEPPVFVGFGSMSGAGIDRVGQMIVEAVSATGMRCIVGAGWAGLGGQHALPAGWRVVGDAPHALLFPRMAAVVHHGGSGTMAQALRAGVPQVILPLFLDQYHHAHRLFVAGLVPRTVPMERVTATQLAEAIRATIVLPKPPREAVAQRLRASDGKGQIVDRVEALCNTATSV